MKHSNKTFVWLCKILFLISFEVKAHDVCIDNPFKFDLFGKWKRCSNYKASSKKCKKNKTVKRNCPKTCGLCEELCLDHIENAEKICLFVDQNKQSCIEDEAFRALCPKECKFEWTKIGNDIDGEDANDYSGYSVSTSADGLTLAIGAYRHDGNGSDSGHVRVYKFDKNVWVKLGSNINGEAPGDRSGSSVSLSADGFTLAVGAYGNDALGSCTGNVRVYTYDIDYDRWSLLGNAIDGESSLDYFGSSVSMSDDGLTVAIGAFGNDDNGYDSGHVKVFKYFNGTWEQLGNNIDGENTKDKFGYSVSMSADGLTVAISAIGHDANGVGDSGHVRVYKYEILNSEYTSNSWTQLGNDMEGHTADANFGSSVSLSADGLTLAIGDVSEVQDDYNGNVEVYTFENNKWIQLGDDIYGDYDDDSSIYSVSLSADGRTVAIGAMYNGGSENGSHVRIFKYVSDGWLQFGDDIKGESANDQSGYSVSLSADGLTVAIGAPLNTDKRGHVRSYTLY